MSCETTNALGDLYTCSDGEPCMRRSNLIKLSIKFKCNTFIYLDLGIFSDTHMLALMYAGELCYWHSQVLKKLPSTHTPKLDSKATGKVLLRKYMEVVEGPLKDQGWNCDRAKELIEILNHGSEGES